MNSYLALKNHINKGGEKLKDITERLTTFAANGEITLEEKHELESLAREKASVENEADLFAVVLDLAKRVRALEEGKATESVPPAEADPEEFVVGKWYYNGDRCMFGGKKYKCIAPDGVVCVWSPADYPAYWEAEA